ncbi:unnamed protein product [Cladocopium goreaui]|uniref:Type II methyltransferase M.MthTI (M.MthTI) (Cytosine-specific methyltransferase MthTI) (Modification methylase MthTI) n=1 Tax=Cladocopium goreaui TaxID=2562237 RepID=A0A9P1CUV8_9DINO|nr:unnamed protein product [Cladocopium goreaui]
MVRLCWLLWLAVALAAPETPPRPSEPGSGSGSGVPAGAAANNLAGQLAHQIWQILQGSVTAPPGMLSGPSASEAAAPSVGAPGHSAPTHGASSSAPGPLPAATNPPGPTEESEEPPWRRSRSRLPPAAASAEPPAPPPLVSAPPPGPGSAAAVPTPATDVVDVEREPGESRPAVRLDLRACRVCGAQDLYKSWKNPSRKRQKTNRGKRRPVWWADNKNKWDPEDPEDDDEGGWEPKAPLYKGAELLPETAEPKAKAAKAAAAAKTPKANGSQDPALMANLASGSPGVSSQALCLNGGVWAKHAENVRRFKEQAVSEDAVQLRPNTHSFGQPFDEKAALESLKREGKYLCIMNALWLDQSWSATPQIPISQGAIDQVKSHWFSTPNGLDQQQVTVGFLRREVDSKTVPAFGTWKRLSAEESIIAFFEAAAAEAQKVEAGAAGDQLQEWLGHCLSCPVLIRVVADSQEMEWVAQQLREDQTQLSFLARTPTQRVFDVMQKREAMGVAYTPEALLQLYDEKLKFSAKSEKITKGFLGHASMVMDRALRHDAILQVILAEEACGKSLWDSVSKLHAMVSKSTRFEEVAWLFTHMHDSKLAGLLEGEVSVRQLTGQGATGGKGLCDLVLYKMRLRDYFISDFLLSTEAKEMPEKYRQALKDIFASHEAFRRKVGFPDSPADLSWKAGWSRSADHVMQLIQESVFGTVFDDNLKAAVVAGKAPLDALTMDTKLGERYREFQQLLRQELDEARAEASAAARAEAQQGATQDPEAQEGLPVRSAAFKAFLGDVQAKIGEIKNEETLAQLQYFEDKARNLMASNVQLFVFQPSENELCAYFDKAAACQVRGGGNQWVGIFLDPAQWGEAVTNPHIRVCPLNQQYLKTFLASVVKSRDKQQLTLHHRDLFIYFDSFLPGNLNKVLGSFQTPAGDALNKNSFGVFISYDEESLKQRRQYIKANSTTFQQIELMTLATAENFGDAMTKTNRKIYKGTNFGNKIGDVLLESPKLLWSMALKDKITLFGKYRVSVGGRTTGEAESHRGVSNRKLNTEEPVFWHSRPLSLCLELLASYNLAAVVDAGAGDGNMALACALSRMPYCGLCLTEDHLTQVQDRIVTEIMLRMLSSSESVFEPKLAASLGGDRAGRSSQPSGARTAEQQGVSHPASSGTTGNPPNTSGNDSGTAASVLNEFRAQLANLQQQGASKTAKTTLLPAEPGKVNLIAAQPPNTPAEVTLASDCSGLCTEGPAVRVNLPSSVNVKHIYTSEIEFNWLIQALRDIQLPNGEQCYNVYYKLLDTQHFGIPQHRERVYIIGIRRDVQVKHFEWPVPFKERLTLKQLLGNPAMEWKCNLREKTHDVDGSALSSTARKNLIQFQDFLDKNPAKQDSDFIVDTGGSSATWMEDKCPCLTATRCKGKHCYWWHQGQRFLTPTDFFLLQGVWPGAYKPGDVEELQSFPQRVLGHMIGNAMSVCVVRRLVRCIFQARGIL